MERFFKLHLPRPQLKSVFLAGFGAAIAIAILALAGDLTKTGLLMAPFGASCVLLFAAPAAPFSQPVNVVAGHFVSASIGLAIVMFGPSSLLTGALALGLAVAAMMALRISHPPAGATAFVAGAAGSWIFLFFPVLIGSIALVLIAAIYHRLNGNIYPAK